MKAMNRIEAKKCDHCGTYNGILLYIDLKEAYFCSHCLREWKNEQPKKRTALDLILETIEWQ